MAVIAPQFGPLPPPSPATQQFVLQAEHDAFQAVFTAIEEKRIEHDRTYSDLLVRYTDLEDAVRKYEDKLTKQTPPRTLPADVANKMNQVKVLIDSYNVHHAVTELGDVERNIAYLMQQTRTVPTNAVQRFFPRMARVFGRISAASFTQAALDNETTVRAMGETALNATRQLESVHKQIELDLVQAKRLVDGLRQLL